MSRMKLLLLLTGCAIGLCAGPPITFHRDIEPLIQVHCQSCHRPGEIGPMSLLNYHEVRPWAAAIKEAVAQRKMPPWFADARAGQHYKGDVSLSEAEAETIKRWVDSGAVEGDPSDAPAPRKFTEGWNIGQPDLIVEMPDAYKIPATGTVEYTYIIIPTGFKRDRWVTAAEIRPGNRASMHHSILFTRPPGSKWLAGYPARVPFVPLTRAGTEHRSSDGDRTIEGSLADEWLVGYVPGQRPLSLPEDTAFLVKAGSDFVLQVHYTPNGKTSSDRTKVGLVFAKTTPLHRALIAAVANGDFAIPPGDANYQVNASRTLAADVRLLGSSPHMHLRGKSMSLRAVYPMGVAETLFSVPHYDFNWQQMYTFAEPPILPRGTRLELSAAFDNSPNNPSNPNPNVTVKWGDQSWDEMVLGVIVIEIKPDTDLDTLFEKPPQEPNQATSTK